MNYLLFGVITYLIFNCSRREGCPLQPWAYFEFIYDIQENCTLRLWLPQKTLAGRLCQFQVSQKIKDSLDTQGSGSLFVSDVLASTHPVHSLSLSAPMDTLVHTDSGLCSIMEVEDGRVPRTVCPRLRSLVSMMSTSKSYGITLSSVISLVAAYKPTCQC